MQHTCCALILRNANAVAILRLIRCILFVKDADLLMLIERERCVAATQLHSLSHALATQAKSGRHGETASKTSSQTILHPSRA